MVTITSNGIFNSLTRHGFVRSLTPIELDEIIFQLVEQSRIELKNNQYTFFGMCQQESDPKPFKTNGYYFFSEGYSFSAFTPEIGGQKMIVLLRESDEHNSKGIAVVSNSDMTLICASQIRGFTTIYTVGAITFERMRMHNIETAGREMYADMNRLYISGPARGLASEVAKSGIPLSEIESQVRRAGSLAAGVGYLLESARRNL